MRFLALIASLALLVSGLSAQSRVAEITDIEGVRDNIIRGVGLVVGLKKTGDQSSLAQRMVASILRRNNINAADDEIGTGNAAVVMVTAKVDPFRRPGSRVDVTVSSMLDATSLFGGTLIETQLTGFDRQTVYAIAEGPMSVGGFSAEGASGSSVSINHDTVATIPNGALVEKSIPMVIKNQGDVVTLNLRNQNWTTANNVAKVINGKFPGVARAANAGSIEIDVPAEMRNRLTEFISEIQDLQVKIHTVSKVVIDERTGVIVAGQDVRISTVAVAQGKLSVTIQETPLPVVAESFTEGPSIAAIPQSDVSIQEENSGLQVVEGGESVARLASSLNALGASPRQLIAILQSIKAAGALQAELIVR